MGSDWEGREKMKFFKDGDQLVITKDDFVDLQESPVVFYPLESEVAKTVLEADTVIALPLGDLAHIVDELNRGQVEAIRRFNRVLQAVGPVLAPQN
jgi:hypothetical protein